MIFLWVQGSIPGPDHLFWARSIRGLCQLNQFKFYSIVIDCHVLHVDGETSPSNHQQIIKSQVNNVVTKIMQEEREDLRKKL